MLNKSASVTAAAALQLIKSEFDWNDKAFLEIGVYKGKFFSLVEQATKGSNCLLVGVDPFRLDGQSLTSVMESFKAEELETNRIHLHEGLSSDRPAIERALGSKELLLCHVDGSHQEKGVLADMLMMDDLLSDRGILIADDFWNARALGVASGIFRLLIEHKSRLVPFMLCNTKLCFCRPEHKSFFKARFIESFEANMDQVHIFNEFITRKRSSKPWVTMQELVGHEIIAI